MVFYGARFGIRGRRLDPDFFHRSYGQLLRLSRTDNDNDHHDGHDDGQDGDLDAGVLGRVHLLIAAHIQLEYRQHYPNKL